MNEFEKKLIDGITDTTTLSVLGSVLLLCLVFVLLFALSKDFRDAVCKKIISIKRIGNTKFGSLPKSTTADQSSPEIKPKQIADGNASSAKENEVTEENLLRKMFFDTFLEENLDELNRTYGKLKGLSTRTKSDEEIQGRWFELRIHLNDDVVAELLSIAEKNHGWYFPHKLLAEYYFKLEEFDRVETLLEEASKRAHEDFQKRELHYLKAEIIDKQHGKEKALEYFKQVEPNAEWSGSKNSLLHKMAEYYGELGNKISQQIHLEKAVHEDPANEDLRFSLAYKYAENQSTYLLALNQYQILIAKNPKHTSALNNIAILYEKLGLKVEHDKYINLAIRHGSAHAKGNYIIDICEKGLLVEAERLIESISEDERKDERILDAIRHLNRAKEAESEKLSKLNPIISFYKKLIESALKSPTDKAKFLGTWKSNNKELNIEIDAQNKITGSYSITTSGGLGSLFFGLGGGKTPPLIKNYSVSGNFETGIADILCIEKGGTLLSSDMISMRLFAVEDHLEGFVWNKADMPEKVVFSR
jgi:tetratricopeptide (TPR) repeat protein